VIGLSQESDLTEYPVLSWDEHELTENQAQGLVLSGLAETVEQAYPMVDLCADWEWFCDELTELLHRISNSKWEWLIEVFDQEYVCRYGHKTLSAKTGRQLLQAVVPDGFRLEVRLIENELRVLACRQGSLMDNEHYRIRATREVT